MAKDKKITGERGTGETTLMSDAPAYLQKGSASEFLKNAQDKNTLIGCIKCDHIKDIDLFVNEIKIICNNCGHEYIFESA